MKYLYIATGLAVILLLLLIILVLCHRYRARCLVRIRPDEVKCRDLDRAIGTFGFRYDICQDIFYSARDAWQREMGYGRIYDEHALSLGMVIDCEPLYFVYNKRSYLFELWKGQYGMTTGAEMGLYVANEVDEEHPERLFYHSVKDEEMLSMRFVLRKQGRILIMRDEVHWWLTGFVLGEYSKPSELSMEVTVTFPCYAMRNAFYEALLAAGYHKNDICVDGLCIRFCFAKPHTLQPKHCRMRVRWVQWRNRRKCRKYLKVTRMFVRTIDRVDYLGMCFPGLYRMLGRLSRYPKRKCPKTGRGRECRGCRNK